MSIKRNSILFLLLLFLVVTVNGQQKKEGKTSLPKAKYVFLFIGDGMGLAHTSLAEAYLASKEGSVGMHKLVMSDFPVQSYQRTTALNRFITCSAAGGTALATGSKTSINTIGMNGDRTKKLFSIATRAHNKGYKVGIMTSVSIDHATPASFYAHQPDRNMYYEIANELVNSHFDYFGGGGLINPTGKKGNKPDLYDAAVKKGFKLVRDRDSFGKLQKSDLPVFVVNPVINEENASMPYVIDHANASFTLAQITKKAIDLLQGPDGFFMMIEGGKIDWAAHSNDAAIVVREVLALDSAVMEAVSFYQKHPNETLIVITADHETGGLALGWAGMKYESNLTLLDQQKGSFDELDSHIKQYKKRALGNFNYDSVALILKKDYGFGESITLNSWEQEQLRRAFLASMTGKGFSQFEEENFILYGGLDPIGATARRILNQKAGIGWTTWSHTGIPVPVRVMGASADIYKDYIENTDIPTFIARSMRLSLENIEK